LKRQKCGSCGDGSYKKEIASLTTSKLFTAVHIFRLWRWLFPLCPLRQRTFPFFTELPTDALRAEFAVAPGVRTAAALFTIAFIVFLADGKSQAVGMAETVHRRS
jgi:hypothetical protein